MQDPDTAGRARKLDLTRTRAALAKYDAEEPGREAMADSAQTDQDVSAWQKAEHDAEREVREAFFQDSKDRNSHSNCMVAGLDWLRRLCQEID